MVLRYDAATDGACAPHALSPNGAPIGGAGWRVALNCSGAVVSLNQTARGGTTAPAERTAAAAAAAGRAAPTKQTAVTASLASPTNPLAYLVVPGEPTPAIQQLWSDAATGSVVARVVRAIFSALHCATGRT